MAFIKFFGYLLFGYFALLTICYLFQRHLIYFPSRYDGSPGAAGVPEMEEIALHPSDGLTIKAWYRPPLQSQFPTLVHFHGNAGHIGNRGMLMKPFLDEGFGVLLLTYRGYSGNPGQPSEEGLYRDARAAMQFLQKQGIPKNCTVLYGDSIGAAVAVQMASEFPVGALVLQVPFTSLAAVGRYHYPIFPIQWLLKDHYDALAKAPEIHVPVLIIHGENDTITPAAFGRELYEAFSGPKQIELIPHADHNDLF
ncbi:MAG: alpha/beta hydrolase [Parachlamydia sp.]|nr:alpha/beta hydrolase [Parachlamydia sp.]